MTTTTAGYGDVYPRTYLGKLCMFLCSMAGVVIVSLIIVTVTNMLEMNLVEYRAFKVAKKLRLKKKLETQAAMVITKAARIWKKVKDRSDIPSYKVTELTNQVEDFHRANNGYLNEKEEGLG